MNTLEETKNKVEFQNDILQKRIEEYQKDYSEFKEKVLGDQKEVSRILKRLLKEMEAQQAAAEEKNKLWLNIPPHTTNAWREGIFLL